jgi:hypothetical protein
MTFCNKNKLWLSWLHNVFHPSVTSKNARQCMKRKLMVTRHSLKNSPYEYNFASFTIFCLTTHKTFLNNIFWLTTFSYIYLLLFQSIFQVLWLIILQLALDTIILRMFGSIMPVYIILLNDCFWFLADQTHNFWVKTTGLVMYNVLCIELDTQYDDCRFNTFCHSQICTNGK